MSAYDYSDRAKPASAHTKAVNAQLAHELGLEGDAPAWRELELAREGLVRAAEDLVIRDGDGHVIWDLDAFRFLRSPVPDERVNPSLWMSGAQTSSRGCSRSCRRRSIRYGALTSRT